MLGITVYINGVGYWFADDIKLIELLDMNCDDAFNDNKKDCGVEYDKIKFSDKIKFNDIKNEHIAIHFDTQTQLEKLIDYLKVYGYNYGIGRYSSLDEIKDLTVNYFGKSNQYISLDRCKQQVPFNYCSCGRGYQDIIYEFDDIDWGI